MGGGHIFSSENSTLYLVLKNYIWLFASDEMPKILISGLKYLISTVFHRLGPINDFVVVL